MLEGAADAGTAAGGASEAARLQQLMLEGAAARAAEADDGDVGDGSGNADEDPEDGSGDDFEYYAFIAKAVSHPDMLALEGDWSDRSRLNKYLLKETIYCPGTTRLSAASPCQGRDGIATDNRLRRRKGFQVHPNSRLMQHHDPVGALPNTIRASSHCVNFWIQFLDPDDAIQKLTLDCSDARSYDVAQDLYQDIQEER
jgi:hypothetical protein